VFACSRRNVQPLEALKGKRWRHIRMRRDEVEFSYLVTAVQPRVLHIGFQCIDVWRPEGKPVLNGLNAVTHGFVVLCPGLSGDDIGFAANEFCIPCGRYADGRREKSRVA
jgi:hypothetical protein